MTTNTHTATRPIMTAAEFAAHRTSGHGRDYSLSDDGYDDMDVANARGWHTLSSWGRDGWNLGDWPYVVIFVKDDTDGYWLLSVCEGDHDYYKFATSQDRSAALDYLFLWYSADEQWSPVTWENRKDLDAGTLRVEPQFRGPYQPNQPAWAVRP